MKHASLGTNSDDIYIKIPATINISKFPAIRWGLDATRLMGGAPEMKDRTLLWFEWCDREGLLHGSQSQRVSVREVKRAALNIPIHIFQ